MTQESEFGHLFFFFSSFQLLHFLNVLTVQCNKFEMLIRFFKTFCSGGLKIPPGTNLLSAVTAAHA